MTVELTPETEAMFNKLRAEIITEILALNDQKLLANLMDNSHRIIFHPDNLRKIIACFCGLNVEQVLIVTIDEPDCCDCMHLKTKPFKKINAINIQRDGGTINFFEFYPDHVKDLTEVYKVSLSRCFRDLKAELFGLRKH